jgi:hypothetical protein
MPGKKVVEKVEAKQKLTAVLLADSFTQVRATDRSWNISIPVRFLMLNYPPVEVPAHNCRET